MSLDELKIRIKDIPISQIIGMYINVVKKGTQFTAICPFHDDHNPSLSINDSKGLFMCFVDSTGGDAITFVQKYKNLDYISTLKDICEKLAWNFSDYEDKKEQSPKFKTAEKILLRASQLYRKTIQEPSPAEYKDFLNSRNIKKEIAEKFAIGFAPKNGILLNYLSSIKNEKEKEFALNISKQIHLIRTSQNTNESFDSFRERIMFPIWNQNGKVVGFGGRQTKDFQKGKYINSQESFFFNKKNILYGLNLSKQSIRQKNFVILVEGYMDLIALHQFQFENSVAVMGVGLSAYCLNSLSTITKNIYMALDSDNAGFEAMKRINTLCMQENITPKLINLAPHKDPDDFLQKEGHLKFQERIEKAKPFIDVLIEKNFPKKVPELTDRKIEILQSFFPHIAPLGKSLSATERIIKLSKKLGLSSDSETIVNGYKEFLKGASKKTFKQNHAIPDTYNKQDQLASEPPKTSPESTPSFSITRTEIILLQEVVQNPIFLKDSNIVELLDFATTDEVKKYIEKIRRLYYEIDKNEYVTVILDITEKESFNSKIKDLIKTYLYRYRPLEIDEKITNKMVYDLKKKLEIEKLKEKKMGLKLKQRQATSQTESTPLLNKLNLIDKQIHELKKNKK